MHPEDKRGCAVDRDLLDRDAKPQPREARNQAGDANLELDAGKVLPDATWNCLVKTRGGLARTGRG